LLLASSSLNPANTRYDPRTNLRMHEVISVLTCCPAIFTRSLESGTAATEPAPPAGADDEDEDDHDLMTTNYYKKIKKIMTIPGLQGQHYPHDTTISWTCPSENENERCLKQTHFAISSVWLSLVFHHSI
jgi:hypothetical protein